MTYPAQRYHEPDTPVRMQVGSGTGSKRQPYGGTEARYLCGIGLFAFLVKIYQTSVLCIGWSRPVRTSRDVNIP